MVRRSIYDTRRPEHPHSPIRQYEQSPQRNCFTTPLQTVEVDKFLDDNNLLIGIIFMEDIWPSYIQNDEVGKLG